MARAPVSRSNLVLFSVQLASWEDSLLLRWKDQASEIFGWAHEAAVWIGLSQDMHKTKSASVQIRRTNISTLHRMIHKQHTTAAEWDTCWAYMWMYNCKNCHVCLHLCNKGQDRVISRMAILVCYAICQFCFICTHIRERDCSSVHVFARIQIRCMCAFVGACVNVHALMGTCAHACMSWCVELCMRACLDLSACACVMLVSGQMLICPPCMQCTHASVHAQLCASTPWLRTLCALLSAHGASLVRACLCVRVYIWWEHCNVQATPFMYAGRLKRD